MTTTRRISWSALWPAAMIAVAAITVFGALDDRARGEGPPQDGKLRVIVFGAHPDDAEIGAGGVGAMWAAQGHHVKFVSTTNGDIGHWQMAGGPLAQRRTEEVEKAAEILGNTVEVLDIHDGELVPSLENRKTITRLIREWDAHIVISHRPNDYHPDHRYTGTLVQDAAYMVMVPFFVPDTPPTSQNPVFLYSADRFQEPNPFRADIVVAIDDVIEQKVDALVVMESQFVEGGALGYRNPLPEDDPEAREARRQQARARFRRGPASTADRYRDKLIETYGEERGREVRYAEAFEITEYGRQPSAEEIRELFPFFEEKEEMAAAPAATLALVMDEARETRGSEAMVVTKESFGETKQGEAVDLYTLTNDSGLSAKIITYGATLIAVEMPDREGNVENVTLYLESLADYEAGHPFFGSVVGRYANRIGNARFTLDGVEYTLAANNGPNHLHGGRVGFDKAVWEAESFTEADAVGVRLTHVSPDGDEGYPGTLSVTMTYRLTADDRLIMDYEATTDAPTIVNLTNHAYWNLGGAGSGDCLGHLVMLNADHYLPVDDGLIPLGPLAEVAGTPMDFTTPHTIGARIDEVPGGYDHCWAINRKAGEELALVARVVEPESGRGMEIHTTKPGVQFYTGNFLDGTLSADGHSYGQYAGFCLETQHFPDSPNKPDYPSPVLRPGETYRHTTIHTFFVE